MHCWQAESSEQLDVCANSTEHASKRLDMPEVELPDAQFSPTEGEFALSVGESKSKLY